MRRAIRSPGQHGRAGRVVAGVARRRRFIAHMFEDRIGLQLVAPDEDWRDQPDMNS